jgi:aryl sulfotransferase
MPELRRYRAVVADSARWAGFRFRPGDIVICTPPKCGTTWVQLLCALLVFDSPDLPAPLTRLSPWLDMQTHDLAGVLAVLEAQSHRRFIKTHTPLDGLPANSDVTYIGVGRDPRDAWLSMENHRANMDRDAFLAARAAAVGADDLTGFGPPPEPPADPRERFLHWTDAEPEPWRHTTLGALVHHLRLLWDRRREPEVVLLHYRDLAADLPGELRRLAAALGIEVADGRVEELAAAATFNRMRRDADVLAPEAGVFWRSNREFFRGSSGRWRDLLDDAALAHYRERLAALAPPDLAGWLHTGWSGSSVPRPGTPAGR